MNAPTLLITVAALFFGFFYFTKMGCKGDGSNGMTGPDGSLCFPGFEALGIGDGGGDTSTPPEDTGNDEAAINPEIKPQLETNIKNMRHPVNKPVNLKSRFGPGVNPYATNLAHAFAAGIEDQITIA